jgi:hypothetical protein
MSGGWQDRRLEQEEGAASGFRRNSRPSTRPARASESGAFHKGVRRGRRDMAAIDPVAPCVQGRSGELLLRWPHSSNAWS